MSRRMRVTAYRADTLQAVEVPKLDRIELAIGKVRLRIHPTGGNGIRITADGPIGSCIEVTPHASNSILVHARRR